jgi:hypothetical protein
MRPGTTPPKLQPAELKLLRYMDNVVKITPSIRPKKVSIQQFIRIIEEIYTAKYRNDMQLMEKEI